MKLQPNHRISTTGHVLWMILVCTALIGLALVGYLKLTQTRTTLTARSQVWNNCMPILEAGVEEALAQLDHYANSNLAANGWTAVSGGFYKERAIAEGYYRVSVSYTNISSPTIISTGYLPAPPTLASANTWFVAQGFAPDPNVTYISRTVRVTCQRQPLLGKALVAKNAIKLNGNNVSTDSYDSTNPLYSDALGQYDPTKRRDNGDVAINSGNLVNVGSLGNADIMGTFHVGPTANPDLGPNGSVGDKAWVSGGNTGFESNHLRMDANFDLPNVDPPWTSGAAPLPAPPPGVKYLLANGNYQMPRLTLLPAETMRIVGNAVLYVTGNVDIRGTFEIMPPNGHLTMYVGGPSTLLGGTFVKSPLPKDFLYFGLPSNTSVDIKCSGMPLNAVIYAPGADVNVISQSSVCGSIMGKTITFVGNSAFHYDESLASLAFKAYVITSWTEI
jgi:hypothetical protein